MVMKPQPLLRLVRLSLNSLISSTWQQQQQRQQQYSCVSSSNEFVS
jgi:hypothetical protein